MVPPFFLSRVVAHSPDEPTGRANARPMTGSAICGVKVPDVAARATLLRFLNPPAIGSPLRTSSPTRSPPSAP